MVVILIMSIGSSLSEDGYVQSDENQDDEFEGFDDEDSTDKSYNSNMVDSPAQQSIGDPKSDSIIVKGSTDLLNRLVDSSMDTEGDSKQNEIREIGNSINPNGLPQNEIREIGIDVCNR
ncbi:hypothetical protein L2E82_35617 [Cichorium intybus]|uniref:Uncharacterized protein n=1 Tax=Cichorium intybus TaxID=13427 RepID=A0ACB9BP98_CICIN|nr:hypothetical protein L2E82_35617 [Cichorium intybus]